MFIAIGHFHSYPLHNIRLYGGVYTCMKCGAVPAHELVHFRRLCGIPTPNLRYNLEACAAGQAPKCFKGWPCSKLKSSDKVVVKNKQFRIDKIWKTDAPQCDRIWLLRIRAEQFGLEWALI